MIWVIVLVALVMVGILVYILTNQDTPQQPQPTKQATAVITPSPTPTEEATNEKARSTRTPEQAPKPDKKHPSIQARPAQTNDDSSSLNNTPQQQEITETTTKETEQEPSEDDAQNATEPESDETDKENGADETSTEEEEEEEKPLQLGADTDASWIEQYNNLVESKLKEDDYNGLRDALKEVLTAADSVAFNAAVVPEKKAKEKEEVSPSPYDDIPPAAAYKLKVKTTKQALAAYYCLELFLAEEETASADENREFMHFLLASGGKPAADFFKGLQKKKVSAATAAELLAELRSMYEEDPKKAAKKIPSLMAASGKMQIRKYYPDDKKAIEKKITDLLKTKPSGGADKEQQEAINLANVYRYICGVAPTLKFDKTYFKQAEDAAAACARAGRIAHDLGHSTDLCNLHQGMDSRAKSIPGYIEDPGEHNRKERGHRNWILDPAAGKTAFGQSGIFHAMRVMDRSCTEKQKYAHSYPGRGYFPARYLHGDGWSYHALPGISVGENPKVEMWRLLSSPKHPVTKADLSPAREIDIKEVFANGNYLVFEPDYNDSSFKRRSDGSLQGVYWIRISWKGFKDEYLVEFY